jgi:heme exporter protein D
MSALGEFLAMGGYAQFVWPAYGVALVLLAGLALHAARRRRLRRAELEALEARLGPRRRGERA